VIKETHDKGKLNKEGIFYFIIYSKMNMCAHVNAREKKNFYLFPDNAKLNNNRRAT
jgi:hypothetical protein